MGYKIDVIEGVGPALSEKLARNAENLAAKMAAVNASKKLTRAVPSASSLRRWIHEAKEFDPLIQH